MSYLSINVKLWVKKRPPPEGKYLVKLISIYVQLIFPLPHKNKSKGAKGVD